jgi:hypothetical protein
MLTGFRNIEQNPVAFVNIVKRFCFAWQHFLMHVLKEDPVLRFLLVFVLCV